MSEQFFLSLQQNIKLMIWAPLLATIFRIIFIIVYNPYPSLRGRWQSLIGALRYGFWWGMDFDAYVFLIPLVLITIPGLWFDIYHQYEDLIRITALILYSCVLYAAFAGKMIFYKHFHDTYNYMVHYGNHAEKRNLIDVFFFQDKGAFVLLGFIPISLASWYMGSLFLSLPSIPYPGYYLTDTWMIVGWNILIVVLSIILFYWFRYGGTLSHDDKPEWDTIPTVVKEDIFFARATVPDLCALETVYKNPLRSEYTASEEDINDAIKRIVPNEFKDTWQQLDNPLYAFKKITKGPKIKKPKHIFFIVGESIPQWSLDETHKLLNICPGLWNFKSQSHTVQIPNFLPAGNVSRPSIVSLMSGIYDAGLEINERESFWKGVFPTSFAHQMKRLGYQTIYWYGGNASYGNFNHFGKAQGFDRVESASIFCGPDAPKTWVGVYDHVFLENIEQQIKSINEPTFHFIYTTSNHGPYKMEDSLLDYDPEKVMPDVGEDLRSNKTRNKELATYRYSDKAIFTFVEAMKKAFPDSLFIVTGDHSNLFGSLNNTSLIRRDYTLRDTFCTVALLQHPDLNQDMIVSSKGTHMSLMPTIIEAIAPKGFEYYSIAPSLFEDQPETLVTPYQWITDSLIGDVRGDYGESNVATTEPVEPVRPIDNHADNARDWTLLTMWLINHRG
ncbi:MULTISPECIES: LTA synthase family protein [Veillonella]|jgi:putative arylsulfatase|uniref:LTA synthase family protein n=1 Tax=Veillonella TaxID=29465 RepID=UPI00290DDB1D|nr:LTA synthase family protein [Veillonella sp.]MBS6140277.1 LTA synthase family protein [Veillonella parvula]MDU4713115.1 LTA synthase family protein [Veillonella sp.]